MSLKGFGWSSLRSSFQLACPIDGPIARVEFVQDRYQVLLLELKIQLQNSGSTEVNERRAQVTELTEMGSLRGYLRAKRISGRTNGGIMFRGKEVSVLCTLGYSRHTSGVLCPGICLGWGGQP